MLGSSSIESIEVPWAISELILDRKDLKTFAHSSSLIFDSFNRIVLSKGISQIVIKHCSHQGILLAHLARWMTLCELENYKYSESQHSSGEYQCAFLGEDSR